MPNPSWWPTFELSLIFRHTVVSIAVAVAIWIVGLAVLRFVPSVTEVAERIEALVLLGVLSLLGLELILVLIVGVIGLIGSIWKEDFHAFVAA